MKVKQLLESKSILDDNFIMKLIFKAVHALHPEAKLMTNSKSGKHFIGVSIKPIGTPEGAYVPGCSYILADVRQKNQIWITGESLGSTDGIFRGSAKNPSEVVAELDKRIRQAKKVANENARTV